MNELQNKTVLEVLGDKISFGNFTKNIGDKNLNQIFVNKFLADLLSDNKFTVQKIDGEAYFVRNIV